MFKFNLFILVLAVNLSVFLKFTCSSELNYTHFCSEIERTATCSTSNSNSKTTAYCGWFVSTVQCFAVPCAVDYTSVCEACQNTQVNVVTNGPCSSVKDIYLGSKGDLTICQKFHRDAVCSYLYQPVCGILEDQTMTTYSNACQACADANVVKYQNGECFLGEYYYSSGSSISIEPATGLVDPIPSAISSSSSGTASSGTATTTSVGSEKISSGATSGSIGDVSPDYYPIDYYTNCTDADRKVSSCTKDIEQVCGEYTNGTQETFDNKCLACKNSEIELFYNYSCYIPIDYNYNYTEPETIDCSSSTSFLDSECPTDKSSQACVIFNNGTQVIFVNKCVACKEQEINEIYQGECQVFYEADNMLLTAQTVATGLFKSNTNFSFNLVQFNQIMSFLMIFILLIFK